MNCTQCGEIAAQFSEGVCIDCQSANQSALDQHNAEIDAWDKMAQRWRDELIGMTP